MTKSEWEKAKEKYRKLRDIDELDRIEAMPDEVHEKAKKVAKALMEPEPKESDD